MPLLTEISAAARQLRRAPGFTALAVTTLAVAIGVNVAIFSLFHSILLAPLPFRDSGRLVGVSSTNQVKALAQPALSAADFRDLHERAKQFSALGAYRPDFASYAPTQGDTVQLVAAHVTEDLFRVLGVAPVQGRLFRPEEFTLGAARTVLLSHACWLRVFGARTDVIGTTIRLNSVPTTIVGVMPEHFREPEFADVWLPFPQESPEYLARDSRFWTTIGRVRDGASLAAAQADVTVVATALADEYSAVNKGWTFTVQPLLEQRVGGLRRSLVALVAAVGLVLLVGCVNLANLMLARGLMRMPQMGLRLALGATPGALARNVIWECVMLSVAGGTLGTGFAAAAVPWLADRLPPGTVPRLHAVQVDGAALGFAAAMSILTGLAFGLLPAWQVLRANLNDLVKGSGMRGTRGPFAGRVQNALISAQVAVTLVVLAGAALLVRSLVALQHTPPGFDAANVLTVRIAPAEVNWEDLATMNGYYDRILAAVRSAPGVEAVAFDSSAPLAGLSLRYPFWVQGRPRTEGNADEAVFHSVSPDLAATLKLAVHRGRFIDARDDARSAKVCVINEAFARRIFPGEDPLGKRVQTLPWMVSQYREIVGVVADAKQDNLSDPVPPQIFVPQAQSPWFFSTLVVRTRGGASGAAEVRQALRRVDPALAMPLIPLADRIAGTAAQPRLRAWLFSLFGAAALGLSAFGIYASMTFTVRQRTREIGVRMALGATPLEIVRWILWRALQLALAGVVAGLVLWVPSLSLIRGLLYGVGADDPAMMGTLALLLPLIALIASLQAAWQAARLNPITALQQE